MPFDETPTQLPDLWSDVRARDFNLWGYIDVRDAALSCRLSLDADVPTTESFVIAAADTMMDRPTRELLAERFPDVDVTVGHCLKDRLPLVSRSGPDPAVREHEDAQRHQLLVAFTEEDRRTGTVNFGMGRAGVDAGGHVVSGSTSIRSAQAGESSGPRKLAGGNEPSLAPPDVRRCE